MGDMFRAMQAWNTFRKNHPKFPAFLDAVRREGIHEGTVVDLKITTPDGKALETNFRVTESDLELFEMLKGIR